MHAFNISEQAVPVQVVFQSNVIFNIRTRSQHMKHAERVFIYFIRLPAFNPDVLLHSEQAAQLHCIIHVEAAADKGCGGSDLPSDAPASKVHPARRIVPSLMKVNARV